MSKVVILGAGSSKECGLPLGDEVFGCLDYNNGPPWYRFLNDVFPQFVAGISEYPTFEIILSLIRHYMRDKQNLGKYLPSELVSIYNSLIVSYREIFNKKCSNAISEFKDNNLMSDAEEVRKNFVGWYENFFKQLLNENSDTIFISINYDILLDLTLSCMVGREEIKDFTYGIELYDLQNQDERCRETGVLLLKPHGSINLAQCPKCKKIFDGTLGINDAMIKENYCICKSCNNNLDILMLPPTFCKSDEYEPYTGIHKKISEEISKADEILIIGYSLPDYDLNILKAFLKGVVENKNRLKLDIKIVDKEKEGIDKKDRNGEKLKNKYGSIFNRTENKITYHPEGFKRYVENSRKKNKAALSN